MVTLRLQYTKEKYMIFLGHLELMKLFERVFRFNKLPLKFSEGFSPIPKMTFASPLSVGYSSKYEVMEVQLNNEVPLESVLKLVFPEGINIIQASYVESKKSLMASLTHSEYLIKIEFKHSIAQLPFAEWIQTFLEAGTIEFEKKAKNGKMRTLNVLDYIRTLNFIFSDEDELILRTILQTGSQGSLNPETLVRVFMDYFKLPQEIERIQVEKLALYYEENGVLKTLFELKE